MHKIFQIITEVFGWLQIALSPTLIGIGMGLGIYYFFPNLIGVLIGIMVALIGLIIGFKWAMHKYKKTGTIHFLSSLKNMQELSKGQNNKIDHDRIKK